jgi:hypothetical protein
MSNSQAIAEIAQALRQLASAIERVAKNDGPAPSRAQRKQPPTRAKLKLSPARREALKWQGRYMSAVRTARPREAARLRAIYAQRGPRAALQSRPR